MRLWIYKILFTSFMGTCLVESAYAQQQKILQLQSELARLKHQPRYSEDSSYLNTVNELGFIYADSAPDSAFVLMKNQVAMCRNIAYTQGEVTAYKIIGNAFQTKGNFEEALVLYDSALALAENTGDRRAIPGIVNNIGLVHLNQGNYPEALRRFYEALKLSVLSKDELVTASTLNNLAIVYFYQGNMKMADSAYKQTLQIARQMNDTVGIILAHNNIAEVNLEEKKPGAALSNLRIAYALAAANNRPELLVATINTLGNSLYQLDSLSEALVQFDAALSLATAQGYGLAVCKAHLGLAKVQHRQGRLQPALLNGLSALEKAMAMGQAQLVRDAHEIVAFIYGATNNANKAIEHYRAYKLYSDSLNNIAGERAAAAYRAGYQLEKKQLEFQQKSEQQRWISFAALAAACTLGIIVWIIYRNKNTINKAYKELQQKNNIIVEEKRKAEEAFNRLQEAQLQLIQAEKMASLGELTAGIAHEIQNPLNFVNNFSELNQELLTEMKEDIDNGRSEEIRSLINDIIVNEQKIYHHGKRAEDIVRGMLQHSRNSGVKEPVAVNKLVDEYLRLAYHGLRAKDKSFNANIETAYDDNINSASLVPQEIGRVLLNLITNAFHAAASRPTENGYLNPASPGFENIARVPTVWVATQKEGAFFKVIIRDNGPGIPAKIIDKIFQPFFTTKPTGQGTGLGLSISYDIVKAHGGTLKVETKENVGSTFTLQLPID